MIALVAREGRKGVWSIDAIWVALKFHKVLPRMDKTSLLNLNLNYEKLQLN